MTNTPAAPRVTIELDGRELDMVLDFNAIIAFEEESGVNIMEEGESEEEFNFGLREIRALLYAVLKAEHPDPDFSLEDAGRLVHFGNMGYVSDKITELYRVSTPDRGDGDGSTVPLAEAETASTG